MIGSLTPATRSRSHEPPGEAISFKITARGHSCPAAPSVGSSQVADDGPVHFQRIDRSDLAGDDFSTRSDYPRIGVRAGSFLVQGLGEHIVVTCLEDLIGRRDVVLLGDLDRLGLLLRAVEADRHKPEGRPRYIRSSCRTRAIRPRTGLTRSPRR